VRKERGSHVRVVDIFAELGRARLRGKLENAILIGNIAAAGTIRQK
jgi:hypothetical protein